MIPVCPGQSVADLTGIHIRRTQPHRTQQPAVAILIIARDDDRALRNYCGNRLPGTLAKGLILFRRINAGKTNARQSVVLFNNLDGIPFRHTHNPAADICPG